MHPSPSNDFESKHSLKESNRYGEKINEIGYGIDALKESLCLKEMEEDQAAVHDGPTSEKENGKYDITDLKKKVKDA